MPRLPTSWVLTQPLGTTKVRRLAEKANAPDKTYAVLHKQCQVLRRQYERYAPLRGAYRSFLRV